MSRILIVSESAKGRDFFESLILKYGEHEIFTADDKMCIRDRFGPAMESADPSIRNSNLLPVKANGDVRLRSVVSFLKFGSTCTPIRCV